jgi:hypothetical protein
LFSCVHCEIIGIMKTRQGRTVAVWSVVLGVLVLVGAGWAMRERVAEEYWLYRLEDGDEEEKRVAVERLGEIGSARALPIILVGSVEDPEKYYLHRAARRIVSQRRKESLSMLLSLVEKERWPARHLAIEFLGEFGSDAARAVPALFRALNDEDGRVRLAASHALWLIEPAPGGTEGNE